MVEHRQAVPRHFVDKVFHPFKVPEETVIRKFASLNDLFSILESEEEPFTVLNSGVRDFMNRYGVSYDLSGIHVPIARFEGFNTKPVRITRMAFLKQKVGNRTHFIVAETNSYLSDIEMKQYDPNKGDIYLFNLVKKRKKNEEPTVDSQDTRDRYASYIRLYRGKQEKNKNTNLGYGVIQNAYQRSLIKDGKGVLNLLKNWVYSIDPEMY